MGREGPFLETVCVPFAGLAIVLWPLAVLGAVLASFFSSFFLGLYAGVIVHQVCAVITSFLLHSSNSWQIIIENAEILHVSSLIFISDYEYWWVFCPVCIQEDSVRMGLAYIVSVISLFDEYANDLLYLTEGSCFPRYHLRLGF